MRKNNETKGSSKSAESAAGTLRRRSNKVLIAFMSLTIIIIFSPILLLRSANRPYMRDVTSVDTTANAFPTTHVPLSGLSETNYNESLLMSLNSTNIHSTAYFEPKTTRVERLVRIRDEKILREYRFFRLRDRTSGLWLSRPVNTNVEHTGSMEKTFQFRYHSGHYEGWSIQGHTRMHLTSENNDRVTVDRLWARGYEMWFVAFGDSDSHALQKLLSRETSNNKNTQSEGECLYLVSRRNRRGISIKDDQLWATGDNRQNIACFELFAVDSPACRADAAITDEAMTAALVEEGYISNLTRKKQNKKVDIHGQKFQSIVRAIMCWGPIPRFSNQSFSTADDNQTSVFPIFGSPKPPAHLLPADSANAFDGVLIARRTIANWALLEGMSPYLLVDKDITERLVESVGSDLEQYGKTKSLAKTYRVKVGRQFEIHSQYSQPTYRGLFKAALKAYPDAPAVMYSNMDILYTPQLVHTVRAMLRFVAEDKERQLRILRQKGLSETHYKVKGWMIVGQRINYEVPPNWSPLTHEGWAEDMESRFARKGEVFESDAEDYFIVSRDLFDWNQIPDFVVGGVAFDNWLVSKGNERAAEGTAIVVDGTKTIVALHQNHGKNSKDSHKHPKSQYNSHLAAMHGGITLGHTSDALFATEIDPQGHISVYDKHRLLFK